MAKKVQIGARWVGPGEPCFVIAEAGSNHDGSLEQARGLIEVAANAGADAVKFQCFRADRVYPKAAGQSRYLQSSRSIHEILSELEMPFEWLPLLAATCREKGILFSVSVFDEDCADQVSPYVEFFKIASYEMTHLPLIRHVAALGKPVILSTGAATLEEVTEAVGMFRETGNEHLMLMQCTAAYPAPLESLQVRVIPMLQAAFGIPVGLSDHSSDPIIGPLAAVAAGANLIEKHFTLSNLLPGPDHPFALEPPGLNRMIQGIRQAEQALGQGEKLAQPVEAELRAFARRSIFSIREIRAGEALTRDNIAVLRCGQLRPGLPPRVFTELLGRRAARDIPAESPIQKEDVSGEPEGLRIRPVTQAECRLLWEWVNDPEVRKSAFDSRAIPWEEHVSWFAQKTGDPRCRLYLLEDCQRPVGQVRFEVQEDESAEVALSIARPDRGRGYGRKALRLALEAFSREGGNRPIIAHIRPDNAVSLRTFEKAGFVLQGKVSVKGQEALRWIWERRVPSKSVKG